MRHWWQWMARGATNPGQLSNEYVDTNAINYTDSSNVTVYVSA